MIPIHLMLHDHLRRAARARPDGVAVRDPDRALTYAELARAARAGAAGLRDAGVGPGDRVVLTAGNGVGFAQAYWAVLEAGAVVVPLAPETPRERLAYVVADCAPSAVIADPADAPALRAALANATPVLATDGDWTRAGPAEGRGPADGRIDQDLGCIIYTSGSTGPPKGVMLSHQNLVTAARSVATYLGYRPQDRIFVAIPLSFDYGMHQLTMAALVGATAVLERGFARPLYALDRMTKAGATVLPLVPSMVPMIEALAPRLDLSAVRLVSSTAAALAPRQIERLGAIFPRATIFSMYGLTECHRCTYVPPERLAEKVGSVGIAIPNTELWVIDAEGRRHRRDAEGELVIRGATVMKGYWNAPERTAQRLRPGPFPGEFVFHTGDVCRLDAEGFVHFVARMDDILKIKDEKVAPKEVEDVLRAHPAVADAIAYGCAARGGGVTLRAAVTLRAGARAEADALREWCRERLVPAAVPQRVEMHATFRLTANGKIDRTQFA